MFKSKLSLPCCTSCCCYTKSLTFQVQTNLETSRPAAMSQQEVYNQRWLSKDEMGQGYLELLGIRISTGDRREALAGPMARSKCSGIQERPEVCCPLAMKRH